MAFYLDKRFLVNGKDSKINLSDSLNLTNYINTLAATAAAAADLTSVLVAGNVTGGNDIVMTTSDAIKSSSTSFQINMDEGGEFLISSDLGVWNESYLYMNASTVEMGVSAGSNSITSNTTANQIQFNTNNCQTRIGYNVFSQQDITGWTILDDVVITIADASADRQRTNSNARALILNPGIGFLNNYKAGVSGAVIAGGIGITAKTNDTLYSNQVAIQQSTSAFEGVLTPPVLTADRIWDFPDADGTVLINRVLSTAIGVTAANGQTILGTSGVGGITVTLPATPVQNDRITIKKVDAGAGALTVDGNGNTIDGLATQPLGTQWEYMTVESDGTNWFIVAQG